MAGTDGEVGDARRRQRAEGAEPKAEIAGRPAGGSDDVGRQTPQLMEHQGGLLVPVGIELNAPLLGDDAAEVFEPVERRAAEVGFHGGSPPGAGKGSGIRPEYQPINGAGETRAAFSRGAPRPSMPC